ncbi:MAG TPA: flap endonuclease Xni [Gammaproteobacteria bacterium]|nr:flap endonuclease Xni [Gammaproteobacteria bacterium]
MSLAGVRLLLVDAPNLIRRIHAAVPGQDRTQKIDQTVSSSLASLKRALTLHSPTHVLCAFESEGPTWRHAINPDYKKDRPAMPAELREIYTKCKEGFEQDGIHSVNIDGMEADDIIASTATRAASLGASVTILSTDTGQAQLLSNNINQYDHFKDKPITPDSIRDKLGIEPLQLVDYYALVGDGSHSLSGVPGVGAKTAARLLGSYPDLEAIIKNREEIGGRVGENLGEHAQTASQTRQLVSLRTDISIEKSLKDFRYKPAS